LSVSKKQFRKFYEEEAHQKDRQRIYIEGKRHELWWHRKRLSYIMSFLHESLGVTGASTLLDVGCADGYYISLLSSSFGGKIECIGVDISRTYVKKAKKRNPGADFMVCDAENLPFVERFFNIVLCSEVLEHLLNPVNALSELLRVTKDDLIISFPGHTYLYKMLSKVGWMIRRVLDKTFWLNVGHISEVSSELVESFAESYAKGSKIEAKQSGALPLQLYRFIPSTRMIEAIDKAICHILRDKGLENTTIQVIKISKFISKAS